MQHTTFQSNRWKNQLFKTIGYDKKSKTLAVYLQSGDVEYFYDVHESTVFKLIITVNKDDFYNSMLITHFSSMETNDQNIIYQSFSELSW